MKKSVYLGGTCNESKWRDELISMLEIDYFNPVVDDWNEEAGQNEFKARQECDYLLYVVTPEMTGVYSIAEAVDDSNKQPEKTIFIYINKYLIKDTRYTYFDKGQLRSLDAVSKMIERNGGTTFKTLEECATYLNNYG